MKAVDLSSMQVITRDKFTLLPVPPSVLEYLNGIAEKQKREISKDIVFRFGYNINRFVNDNDPDDVLKALLINWLIVQPSVFTTGVISTFLPLIWMHMSYLLSLRRQTNRSRLLSSL
jgi:hypothetical protein